MTYFIWGLTLLFIGLKLSNIITWSWWFVLCPVPLYIILYAICYTIYELNEYRKDPVDYERRKRLRNLMNGNF